ncbi:hypothetical protein ES708_31819 [subsurface metagenome]
MFTKDAKKKVNSHLEKAQLALQPDREESDELQYLWQAIIHLQVALERIPAEGE